MNGIVIYKSRYGAAAKYAEWIAESQHIQALCIEDVHTVQLATFDYVILGSSIYMGKALFKDWLAAHSVALSSKKLYIYIVGAAPPDEKQKTNKYFTDNVPRPLQPFAKYFYLQGKSVFSELNLCDKFFLKMGAMLAKEARDKNAMLTDFNNVRKENLSELLQSVKTFRTSHIRSLDTLKEATGVSSIAA